MSEIDDTIPLGAPTNIMFRFNGEGTTTISASTPLELYPLFHTPAIEPSNIRFDAELQEATVSYNHVSPSLTGQYVLCQEPRPPPSDRRKRGVAPQENMPRLCGGRLTLNIIGKSVYVLYYFAEGFHY